MKNLKKALTKYNPNTSHKSKIQISTFKKKSKWDDLQLAIESVEQKNMASINYKTMEQIFLKIIENSFSNGMLMNIQKLNNDLVDKYKASTNNNHDNFSAEILAIIETMILKQSSNTLKKYLQISLDQLTKLHQSKKRQQKQKCLKEYNKYLHKATQITKSKQNNHLSFLHPPSKLQIQGQYQPNNKLLHSTSLNNIKIRKRREDDDVDYDLKKKKSLDCKFQDSRSVKQLTNLLKDNIKPVKITTKKQYDFSAIFEASKSNIQSRNKTFKTNEEIKKQGSKLPKNKDGKDNAFIFYRPSHKKKI